LCGQGLRSKERDCKTQYFESFHDETIIYVAYSLRCKGHRLQRQSSYKGGSLCCKYRRCVAICSWAKIPCCRQPFIGRSMKSTTLCPHPVIHLAVFPWFFVASNSPIIKGNELSRPHAHYRKQHRGNNQRPQGQLQ
jgi:hypothetical protein